MSMEVLLRRSIEGVGQVGEIVRVKNGYARNYLLPQGLAAIVSPESLKRIEQDRKDEAVREAAAAKERATLAAVLSEVTLTIEARAGEDGHLYGSVGPRQLIAAFLEMGYKFTDRQIRFETVRELGEYETQVVLSADTTVPVKVWVVQDAAEAHALAREAAKAAEEASEGTEEGAAEGSEATEAQTEPAADA